MKLLNFMLIGAVCDARRGGGMKMDDWIREELAEEQGYSFCPLQDSYVICDKDCLACETYIDFIKSIEFSE